MLTGDDVVLGVLPLFHVYGLNAVLGQVLRQQAPAGAGRRLRHGGLARRSSRTRRSRVLPVAPPVFAYWQAVPDLARAARRRCGWCCPGSAPLSPRAGRRLQRAHRDRGPPGLRPDRGGAGGHLDAAAARTPKPGSVGAALPGIEIRLVDDAGRDARGRGRRRDPVRGANLFCGYWPDGADGPDAEGWYATGDVGFLDARRRPVPGRPAQGAGDRLRVQRLPERGRGRRRRGRRGRRGGRDRRRRTRRPARRWSPTCKPARRVDVRPRRSSSSWCASTARVRLARFKQPTEVHVVDELPHTVTGKVAKGRLRASRRRRRPGAARVSRRRARHALLQAGLPPVRRRPRGRRRRSAPSSARPSTRSTSPPARTPSADRGVRRGDPGDLRRRPAARLLAGRRRPAARRAGLEPRRVDGAAGRTAPRGGGDGSHVLVPRSRSVCSHVHKLLE